MRTPETVVAFAPGRIEIAGNHTDHQGGTTISATVTRGITVEVTPADDDIVTVESEGFGSVSLATSDLSPRADELHTTAALVRGVIAGLISIGVPVAGFSAQVRSQIAPGGGLSSSAAFELALAKALVTLFADDEVPAIELARIAQRAETQWFKKPCGLQDQMVIAYGGIVVLDFADADNPLACPVDFDFTSHGLSICLIDTGSDHRAGTDDFVQLVADMRAASRLLGAARLCEIDRERLLTAIPLLRKRIGDRGALRVLHWVNESQLTTLRADALRRGDVSAFLAATRRSAASSALLLKNSDPSDSPAQPATVAIGLANTLLGNEGACRIHGGGFGGTCIAFVPTERLDVFTSSMDACFRTGCCLPVEVSNVGVKATCK